MSSRNVDMLEMVLGPAQGSHARAVRGQSRAPGGESVIGRRRLIPIKTIEWRAFRCEASATDLDNVVGGRGADHAEK